MYTSNCVHLLAYKLHLNRVALIRYLLGDSDAHRSLGTTDPLLMEDDQILSAFEPRGASFLAFIFPLREFLSPKAPSGSNYLPSGFSI